MIQAGKLETFNGRGFRLSDSDSVERPELPMIGGGKRKGIKGWSKASRARLRLFLLENGAPVGWNGYGVTLTCAGSVLNAEQVKKLWSRFSKGIKGNFCAVWRLEIQKAGRAHWHMIVWADREETDFMFWLRALWLRSLDSLGPDTMELRDGTSVTVKKRSMHAGALSRGVEVVPAFGAVGAWLRYLADHTSKTKQEQVSNLVGCRHWGFIGKKHFVKLSGSLAGELSPRQRARFARVMARLCCPSIPDSRCVFGSRLGFQNRRGCKGRSVWFSRVETGRRIYEYVTSEDIPF